MTTSLLWCVTLFRLSFLLRLHVTRCMFTPLAVSFVSLAFVDGFSGPVTFSAPVVAPAPAVASTPVLSGESCHDELRGAHGSSHREIPSSRRVVRHDGYFIRQLKERYVQLPAQLLSQGKACEVARGSSCGLRCWFLWRCVSRGCLPSCWPLRSSLWITRWQFWSWKGIPRSYKT